MKRFIFSALIILMFFPSCAGQQQKTVQEEVKRSFTLPQVPSMLNTPEARAQFVSEHYWDNFDFADTAYIHLPDITEQALVNFMDLMQHVHQDVVESSISILYEKAAPHTPMLWHFWETMSRYWNDPNSPLKNEDMFITLCKQIEKLSQLEETLKQRASYARNLAEKNRIGHLATDFYYTLASGKQSRLHQIKADYTLIYFFNPDCYTCAEIKSQMKLSGILNGMLDDGTLKILTLYPEEDVALWQEQLGSMSAKWINAYDKGQVLTKDLLYNLSSIPSFYLLDKEKKVLLKDADWIQIVEYLEKISSK